MVKVKKSPAKRPSSGERQSRTAASAGVKLEPPKSPAQPPDSKKSRGKPVVERREEDERLLELGGQRQRWLNFIRQHSVSPEEGAKLLLDSFEYKGLVKHSGGCHCGAVRFEVWASADIHVFDCNCSICVKKQNRHFIVPASHFTLLKGANNLTTYTFNTKKAQHTFCKTCGVQSFYTPRSNPDGYGIAPHCLDEGTVRNIHVEQINGKEWEKAMKEHKTIRSMSKS